MNRTKQLSGEPKHSKTLHVSFFADLIVVLSVSDGILLFNFQPNLNAKQTLVLCFSDL